MEKIISIKGFDVDLKCRDFQFEIGKEYEATGKIEACGNGFHACERPIDVFAYYPPASSRYCIVEQWGDTDKETDKTSSRFIKIVSEITLLELSKLQNQWQSKQVYAEEKTATNSGYRSNATNSGYQSNATNAFFKSKYADLAECLNTVRPVFSKHGLSLSQFPSFENGIASVESILMHNSGEWISNVASAPVSKQDAQGVGSATTYLRRYSLAAIAGIAQEDDDANSAIGHKTEAKSADAFITLDQCKTIDSLLKQTNSDVKSFLKFIGAKDITMIAAANYEKAVAALNKKLAEQEDVPQ